jgi:hypothetical protein
MSTIAKIGGVTWASVAKVNGIAVASIAKIDGVDKPAAGGGTSYSNPGGSGDRVGAGTIAITYSPFAPDLMVGTISNLWNGSASSPNNNYFNARTLAGTEFIKFDFGAARFIDEVKFYQET